MSKIQYIMVAFLLVYGVCDAATFHVRSDGNDSSCNGLANSSAASAPNCAKKTVQAGVNLASAGDTVIVYAGNYSSIVPTFKTVRAGASGKLITIKAAPGETVVVSRFTLDHEYTKGEGFRIIAAGGFYDSGVRVNASNTTVSGNTIIGRGKSCWGILVNWKDNVTIYGNILEGSNTIATTFEGAVYVGGSNITISHNIIRNLDSVERAFEAYGNGITFSNNEVYNWNQTDFTPHPDIFQLVSDNVDSKNVIVENNYFHDLASQIGNMRVTGGTYSWTFNNNIFANITSSMFGHIPVAFYNNLFYRCGTQQSHPLIFNYSGGKLTVKNNAFVGCGQGDAAGRGWYDVAAVRDYNFVSTVSGGSKSGFGGVETHGVNGGKLGFMAAYSNCVIKACNFTIDSGSALRSLGSSWGIGPYEGPANGVSAPTNLRIENP